MSKDGEVVTCAHVVRAAGVNPHVVHAGPIGVYFPRAPDDLKACTAEVDRCLTEYDDDVVVLRLRNARSPAGTIEPAVLGVPDASDEREFVSYGFRKLDQYQAGRASGVIKGEVDHPVTGRFLTDPLELRSGEITSGMSGAPVLEKRRNLVVGIISETWFADATGKDRDTGWGVNATVFRFAPMSLPIQDEPHALRDVPEPLVPEPVRAAPRALDVAGNPPENLKDFVGRTGLLDALSARWQSGRPSIVALVGFGGEGKTSLARHWLDQIRGSHEPAQPEAIFWWTFHRPEMVDDFFEQALRHFAGDETAQRIKDPLLRAAYIGQLLVSHRYILVLDGVEAVQRTQGDQFTDLTNSALLKLLSYFDGSSGGFCLLTSRLPLLELEHLAIYEHYDVGRLTADEGEALLREVGVYSPTPDLRSVVTAWDGHALTLALLGRYVASAGGGLLSSIADVVVASSPESRFEQVGNVLQWYEGRLPAQEQALLMLLSVFRKPAETRMLTEALRRCDRHALALDPTHLSQARVALALQRLEGYQIVRATEDRERFSTHALIKRHFYERLQACGQAARAHRVASECYLVQADADAEPRTIDDYSPLIEAVYHACRAGEFEHGLKLYRDRIERGMANLQYRFGAFDTDLLLILEFFDGKTAAGAPLISDEGAAIFLLRAAGLALMTVGRLDEARRPFELSRARAKASGDIGAAGRARQATSELDLHLGELQGSVHSARHAVKLYRQLCTKPIATRSLSEELWGVQNSSFGPYELRVLALCYEGWAYHLAGQLQKAAARFARAAKITRTIDRSLQGPLDLWGIYLADHLRMMGDTPRAKNLTLRNLEYAEFNHSVDVRSQCHRLLGDLDVAHRPESAQTHYENALRLARGISHRAVLIEALLAYGLWEARTRDEQATDHIREGLEYACAGRYRVYEVDAHIALGWASLSARDRSAAAASATTAERLSRDIGYHWGYENCRELLSASATASVVGSRDRLDEEQPD